MIKSIFILHEACLKHLVYTEILYEAEYLWVLCISKHETSGPLTIFKVYPITAGRHGLPQATASEKEDLPIEKIKGT